LILQGFFRGWVRMSARGGLGLGRVSLAADLTHSGWPEALGWSRSTLTGLLPASLPVLRMASTSETLRSGQSCFKRRCCRRNWAIGNDRCQEKPGTGIGVWMFPDVIRNIGKVFLNFKPAVEAVSKDFPKDQLNSKTKSSESS
jgi:hypothetical protein